MYDTPDMIKLPKIAAIDFDGTLVEDKFPEIGKPNQPMIDYCKSLKKDGTKIILWTCRNGEKLTEAVEFCKQQGLVFDAVNENLPEVQTMFNGDTRKVYADKYIDDKNGLVVR